MAKYSHTYDSVTEFATVAKRQIHENHYSAIRNGEFLPFTGVGSYDEFDRLTTDGWEAESAAALDIAESAIHTVSMEHEATSFSPLWDVTGSSVDVARYLSGDPENMIDYEPVATPRHGRVIVLCASISVSSAVTGEAIRRRGYAVAALAFALARMGFAAELWADSTVKVDKNIAQQRILVKGPNDELDPARIMFAYAHPGMLRAVALPARHAFPSVIASRLDITGYGNPRDPIEDLPEGTIYLPCLLSDEDVPDADVALTGYLRELGIVTD